MPMMVLSGIFFSYHNFPDWSIAVIRNLPLTMLTDGIRSIFNEGAGWSQVAMPVLDTYVNRSDLFRSRTENIQVALN